MMIYLLMEIEEWWLRIRMKWTWWQCIVRVVLECRLMDSPLPSFVSSFLVTIVGSDLQRGVTLLSTSTMVVIVGWRAPGVEWMMKRRREASRYCNWRSVKTTHASPC